MVNTAQCLHPNGLLLVSFIVLLCCSALLTAPSVVYIKNSSTTINIYGVPKPTEIPPNATWSLAKQEVNIAATRSDLEKIGIFIKDFYDLLFRSGKMTDITTALYSDEHLFDFYNKAANKVWPGQAQVTDVFRKIRAEIKRVYALKPRREVRIDGVMTPIGRKQKWNWVYDLFLLRALFQLFKVGLEAIQSKFATMPDELIAVFADICHSQQEDGEYDFHSYEDDLHASVDVASIKATCPGVLKDLVTKNDVNIRKIGDWFTYRKDNIGEFVSKWEEYNTKMADLFSAVTLAPATSVSSHPAPAAAPQHTDMGSPFDHPELKKIFEHHPEIKNLFDHPELRNAKAYNHPVDHMSPRWDSFEMNQLPRQRRPNNAAANRRQPQQRRWQQRRQRNRPRGRGRGGRDRAPFPDSARFTSFHHDVYDDYYDDACSYGRHSSIYIGVEC